MRKTTDEKTPSAGEVERIRKRLKEKQKRLKVGSFLVFSFLLLYVPSLFNWLNGENVASDILRVGLIEESANADGVVVRDEVLLETLSTDGKYIPEISEGEKAPVSCRVATILNSRSEDLLKELEDINKKIVKAQNDLAEKADFFSEDTAKISLQISQRIQDIITICNSNSLAGLASLENDINGLIEKKAGIIGADSGDTGINSLKKERDSIQSRIDANTGQVVSTYSGIISYIIDGYEEILSPRSIKSLTPEFIEDIKTDAAAFDYGDNAVHANKPFVKVIRGNEIYIAAVLDRKESERFKAGNEIGLRINNTGLETKAVVTDVSIKDGGKCIVTVAINRGIVELSALRKVNADFISKSTEGLKVPLKCLRDFSKDGKKAVIMLIKANCAAKRTVDVISRDNESAVIKTPEGEMKNTVNLYDTYILDPDNIREGEIIDK